MKSGREVRPEDVNFRLELSQEQASAGLLSAAGRLAILLLLVLFPSGRFVPSWLWIPSLLLMLTQIPALEAFLPLEIGAPLFAGLLVCIGASQIYRYRRDSTPGEKCSRVEKIG